MALNVLGVLQERSLYMQGFVIDITSKTTGNNSRKLVIAVFVISGLWTLYQY